MSFSTVPLGRTEVTAPELAFGTWRFGRRNDDGVIEVGRDHTHELFDTYVAASGNLIDIADIYGDGASETYVDEWLGGRDHEEFVVMSKVFQPIHEGTDGRGFNREHLRRRIDRTLDRLGIDYADLLCVHRRDDEAPVEESTRALSGFIHDRKIDYLDTSALEPNTQKVVKTNEPADKYGYESFRVAQPRYNAVSRKIEGNYPDMCADYNIGIVPWSLLAGGFLVSKHACDERPPADPRAADDQRFTDSHLTPASFDAFEQVEEIAEAVGASSVQANLARFVRHPRATAPIVDAQVTDQLDESVVVVGIDLTPDQLERTSVAKRYLSAQQFREQPWAVKCRCRWRVLARTTDDALNADAYVSELRAKYEEKDDFFGSHPQSPIPSEERDDFDGPDYFDPNLDYHVTVSVETYANSEPVTMDTSTGGEVRYLRVVTFYFEFRDTDPIPGIHCQEHDGSLTLFVPLRDKTTRQQTYNGGWYMEFMPDAPLDELEEVVVDFDLAYNSFYAFTGALECPLSSGENWLDVVIPASERDYE